jgi:DNA-binding MarR family transcriptional regulator
MPSTNGRSHPDQCNCFALRKAARRVTRFYDGMLQETGLRVTQYLILAQLHETPGCSINAMADTLDLERTAMGKNLRPLERDGLIRIEPSASDTRTRNVFLARSGEDAFKAARPLWQLAQRRLNKANGSDSISHLRHDLGALVVPEV